MAEYEFFTASDGAKLAYRQFGETGRHAIILIHGFTGSSEYFQRNVDTLAKDFHIITPDLRGHGHSAKTRHGYHVARLATDLQNLIDHLFPDIEIEGKGHELHGVGCSLGAAVLWAHTELYVSSHNRFDTMVFVDQAPLQDYIPGSWSFTHGNYGVHDATSLASAQATLRYAPDDFYRGLVEGCLAYRHQPTEVEKTQISSENAQADEKFFLAISRQGSPEWYAKLLADHTSYDHRDTIRERLRIPCLIMAGKRSGSFPVAGIEETARLIDEGAKESIAMTIRMESGHWMFYEEPEQWSQHIMTWCIERMMNPNTVS